MNITEETKLADVLNLEGANEVLSEFKVPCLGCPMAAMEMGSLTLGAICKNYGIDFEGLKKKLELL